MLIHVDGSQKSQTQKKTFCMIPFTWDLRIKLQIITIVVRSRKHWPTNIDWKEDQGALGVGGLGGEVTEVSSITLWVVSTPVHTTDKTPWTKYKNSFKYPLDVEWMKFKTEVAAVVGEDGVGANGSGSSHPAVRTLTSRFHSSWPAGCAQPPWWKQRKAALGEVSSSSPSSLPSTEAVSVASCAGVAASQLLPWPISLCSCSPLHQFPFFQCLP